MEEDLTLASQLVEHVHNTTEEGLDIHSDTAADQTAKSQSDKKHKSWYNISMYPSYKTRRKEYRTLFNGAEEDGKFIVDYACAYHKDILHQGRMYISTNACSFYSYIFGWENTICVKWKEVTSITKEKYAYFIPNSIQITTESNKYFFASFVDREASYMMLFRMWQAALANELLTDDDICQIIANEYGIEGSALTGDTDDELESGIHNMHDESKELFELDSEIKVILGDFLQNPTLGNSVIDRTFPISLQQLHDLLLTNSNFYFNFQKDRGSTELDVGNWTEESGIRLREVCYNMSLNNVIGPKKCQVKECQRMKSESVPGKIYILEIEIENMGVPYADSFTVFTHICMVQAGEAASRMIVKADIVFKGEIWGFIKEKIESASWEGQKTFYCDLADILTEYKDDQEPALSATPNGNPGRSVVDKLVGKVSSFPTLHGGRRGSHPGHRFLSSSTLLYFIFAFIIISTVINLIVLYRLSRLEIPDLEPSLGDHPAYGDHPAMPWTPSLEDLQRLDEAGWAALVTGQAKVHQDRAEKMKIGLQAAMAAVGQTEKMLTNLKRLMDSDRSYFDWRELIKGLNENGKDAGEEIVEEEEKVGVKEEKDGVEEENLHKVEL